MSSGISSNSMYDDRPEERSLSKKRKDTALFLSQKDGGEVRDYEDDLKYADSHRYDDTALTRDGYKKKDVYPYKSPDGKKVLYEVVRYESDFVPGAKQFRQRRNGPHNIGYIDGQGPDRIPYNWPELISRSLEPIFYVEGEKDADKLMKEGFLATTLSGQNWSPVAAKAFKGRDVIIIPDNDEPGRKNAAQAMRYIRPYAASVKLLTLPNVGFGEDISDWLEKGNLIEDFRALSAKARSLGITASPAEDIDPTRIPPRQWLYKPDYIRGFVSLINSTGGVGKSSLVIAEALAMVTGQQLLHTKCKPLSVWYWNGEDPLDELQRRFAATQKHYGVVFGDIGARLFINSGRDMPMVLVSETARGKTDVDEICVQSIISEINHNKIDVLIVDPFVNSHRVDENNNGDIDLVVKTFARIAAETNCAVMLVHHSRKTNGNEQTVEDGRGASALLAAVRSGRSINTMTKTEAESAGIDAIERRKYFRTNNGKANLSLPVGDATGFKLESIDLCNDFPFGDSIGVVTPWSYPTTEQLIVTEADIVRALNLIRAGGPWRKDRRATKNWVGEPIATALSLDINSSHDKSRIAKLIESWIGSRNLEEYEDKDAQRKKKPFIRAAN